MAGLFFLFFSLVFVSASSLLPFSGLSGASPVHLCTGNRPGCFLSPPPPPPSHLCPPPPPPPPPLHSPPPPLHSPPPPLPPLHSPPPPLHSPPPPLHSPPPPLNSPPPPLHSPPPPLHSPPPPLHSPPPPPPSPPRPPRSPPPPLTRIEKAYVVIQRFKKKITSDPLKITATWVGKNVCAYQGFSCDNEPTSNEVTVSRIDFNNYFFAGPRLSLPGFLDQLPDVTFFHANSNNFSADIPRNIFQLPYFFELDTSNNKYKGPFPAEVLGAKQLLFLDLRFNSYSGPVPPQLFTLDLDVIFINNNQFSAPLPENFGSTPARYLTFANNKFTGTIPSSIGKANRTLTEVLFLNNDFSGCLPHEIGYLEKATLIDASKNRIRGPIPQSFACLEKIELLNLAHNQLFYSVPENLCKLPEIRNLSLSNNFFTQVGQACRKLISKNILDVSNNCIRDLPNQRSEGECDKFFTQAKECPNRNSFNVIPCKSKKYLNPESGRDNAAPPAARVPAATSRQPYTYRALELN